MNTKNFLFGAVALAGLAVASASAQITNSAHDFSTYGWSGGEICKPCHTPHFAIAGQRRLWNHTLTTATYTIEGGGTIDAVADLDYASRMCLSCHDGTVALDSFGGQTGTNFIPGDARIGTDLSDDHPIGAEAVYPSTSTSFNAMTISSSGTSASVTFSGRTLRLKGWTDSTGTLKFVVGCSTCHNPHNKGFPKLLAYSNASSAVCLTCHIK